VTWGPRRRFWRAASVDPAAGGFAVRLDDRSLNTPGSAPLVVPSAALAAAIAAEWDALGATIEPERLPLTRAANAAIDRVAPRPGPVIDAIAAYGAGDLLCYRAASPEALAERQAAGWDPWLQWAARRHGAPLVAVTGVMHQAQPSASLAALRRAVAAHDAFALTALHELVAVSGSLVLALAVAGGALEPERAFALSRLDETWQAEHWGLDPEAEAAAAARKADFLQARRLLELLAPPAPG
jgi:chaperone required for assembly of F1-ATPase